MNRYRYLLSTLLLLALTSSLHAQIALTPAISGNELKAKAELPGGLDVEVAITFEQVVGLNPSALSLTATLLDPTDLALLGRLSGAGLVTVPAAFPVLVRVEPGASSSLSFSGISTLSIYTHALTLGTAPLRLFRAPSGGSFQDMTGFLATGSVRAGGGTGSYSEFLIVADARPLDSVILGKFDALAALLTAHASSMLPAVHAGLSQRLANARAHFEGGAIKEAIGAVEGFGEEVKKQSGAAIPDVWRANSNLVNVAGLLRAGADTLRFSLTLK